MLQSIAGLIKQKQRKLWKKLFKIKPKKSAQQKGFGLPKSSFKCITCNELKWNFFQIHIRRQLTENDFQR